MQNRYTGDVGDFGKLGLLRQIAGAGFCVGVNWYLTPDENTNADGKHISYLEDNRYNGCDEPLRDALRTIVRNQRSVAALEAMQLISNAVYYHDLLPLPEVSRQNWHINALEILNGVDIIFLDPDNGFWIKSVSAGSPKGIKYVIPKEFTDYYAAGKSVIAYNHRCREQESIYLKRFAWMHEDPVLKDAYIAGVKFKRGTVRDYIFALQPDHKEKVMQSLQDMLTGPWSAHFSQLSI